MAEKKLFLILLVIPFLFQSCGSMFDVMGKGAKTQCLSLNTETRTIVCNCEDKQIYSITLYKNKDEKELFGIKTNHFLLNPTAISFTLPVQKDSLDTCFFQLEIHLTGTHWRESYYIDTKPGDFSKSQTIYSRYFSH